MNDSLTPVTRNIQIEKVFTLFFTYFKNNKTDFGFSNELDLNDVVTISKYLFDKNTHPIMVNFKRLNDSGDIDIVQFNSQETLKTLRVFMALMSNIYSDYNEEVKVSELTDMLELVHSEQQLKELFSNHSTHELLMRFSHIPIILNDLTD